jgi:hypothetical protein
MLLSTFPADLTQQSQLFSLREAASDKMPPKNSIGSWFRVKDSDMAEITSANTNVIDR